MYNVLPVSIKSTASDKGNDKERRLSTVTLLLLACLSGTFLCFLVFILEVCKTSTGFFL